MKEESYKVSFEHGHWAVRFRDEIVFIEDRCSDAIQRVIVMTKENW